MVLGNVIGAIVLSLIIGLLARFALPGPDPMPLFLTVAIGLVGFLGGAGIVYAIGGKTAASWLPVAAFFIAVVLVIAYRRFVQKRPVWGRGAYRFPERGLGVEHYRERLKNVGIDPDQIGVGQPYGIAPPGAVARRPVVPPLRDDPGDPTENPAHYLGLLEQLHDSGVLDDSEYDDAKLRLLEKLR
ncbi:MAG TPA: hypothetical protein VGH79_08120 [Gaiellaceae bacterium]|jgi:uncharacterized membrane protein YeaQ/YmgE (transglycosylase-associated protein family)